MTKIVSVRAEMIAGVIAGNLSEQRTFSCTNRIYGTATKLPNNLFITAMHVIRNAKADGDMRLFYPDYQVDKYLTCKFDVIAEYENIDLALLKCNYDVDVSALAVPNDTILKSFNFKIPADGYTLNMMDDVRTMGYPHGINIDENGKINIRDRGYKGHIVANHKTYKGEMSIKGNTWIYELSFSAPKGLSGGPLYNPGGYLCGIIIGNYSAELEDSLKSRIVHQEISEEHAYSLKETTETIHTEYLQHGIAISINELLIQPINNMTVRQFIEKNSSDSK